MKLKKTAMNNKMNFIYWFMGAGVEGGEVFKS
jgi:hypothetical protein